MSFFKTWKKTRRYNETSLKIIDMTSISTTTSIEQQIVFVLQIRITILITTVILSLDQMTIIRRLCRFTIIKCRLVKRSFSLLINFKIVRIKIMFINFDSNSSVLKANIKIKIKIKNFFIRLAFRYSKINNRRRQSSTLNHETCSIFSRFIDFRNRIMLKLTIIDSRISKNFSKNISKAIFKIAIFNRSNEFIMKKNMIKSMTSTKNIKKNTTDKKKKARIEARENLSD